MNFILLGPISRQLSYSEKDGGIQVAASTVCVQTSKLSLYSIRLNVGFYAV